MARAGMLTTALVACSYTAPVQPGDGQTISDTPADSASDAQPPDTQALFWTAVVGASANGNALTKTALNMGWGDSGATTSRSIASGDCFVEFSTAEATTGKAVGLSRGDDSQSFADIDFAVVLGANGRVFIYESGLLRGQLSLYVAGDVFRVEVVGGFVHYRRNGLPLLTSALLPTYPLLVDTALFSPGATITNVVFE